MTTTKILQQYHNGNTVVTLYTDGTKLREYEGIPRPVYPESIDLKVTDRCEEGCAWCHESCSEKGLHAPRERVFEILDGMIPGSEVAIGGGDLLLYPELIPVLIYAKKRGVIANVTFSANSVLLNPTFLPQLRQNCLVYGIGVTWGELFSFEAIDQNTVCHFVAGVHHPMDALSLLKRGIKVLVLGYKKHGRGVEHIPTTLGPWRYWLESLLEAGHICFDNLALEQLGVQQHVSPEIWGHSYMGGDGQFTFYIDAVRDTFAVSSTAERRPRMGRSVVEMFQEVRR